jgi:hypothetical protein
VVEAAAEAAAAISALDATHPADAGMSAGS